MSLHMLYGAKKGDITMTKVYVEQLTGPKVDITDRIKAIFQDMPNWPYEWETYVDNATLVPLFELGELLGVHGASEALARVLDNIQEEVERQRAIEQRHQEYLAAQAARRERQRLANERMTNHLFAIIPQLYETGTAPADPPAETNAELWR